MKAFLGVALAVTAISGCIAGSLVSYLPRLIPETEPELGRALSHTLLKQLKNAKSNKNGEQRVPIIPPFEHDAVQLEDFALHISNESAFADYVYGDLDFCEVKVSGLTSILNDLDLAALLEGLPKGIIKFRLSSATLRVDAQHETNVVISQSLPFSSSGEFSFELYNLTVDIHLEIENVFRKLNLLSLAFDLEDDGFQIFAENSLFEGIPITESKWREISDVLYILVETTWENVIRDPVNEFLFSFLSDFIKECTLLNFIAGDFTCLGADGVEGLQHSIVKEMERVAEIGSSNICRAKRTNTNTI